MTSDRSVYVAWTAFQRRQISMRELVGFECWFFPVARSGSFRKGLSYIYLFFKTLFRLAQDGSVVVWVQVPQVPALWAALLYRALFNRRAKVIADCHNAQLRLPWKSFPLARWSISRADVILVHNDDVLAESKQQHWPQHKVLVLEDVPATGQVRGAPEGVLDYLRRSKPWVVFPGSFAADEPIAEVISAARLLPSANFILTGSTARAGRNGHDISSLPSNVLVTGYLPIETFDELLFAADVVLGLTKTDGIQLSVCNEAIGFGRPLVTSSTALLRRMFGDAAILVDASDSKSIADGCKIALANGSHYSELSRILSVKRVNEWLDQQFEEVRRRIYVVPSGQ